MTDTLREGELISEIMAPERSYVASIVDAMCDYPNPADRTRYIDEIMEFGQYCLVDGIDLADVIETGTFQPPIHGEYVPGLPVRVQVEKNAYMDGFLDGTKAITGVASDMLSENGLESTDTLSGIDLMRAFVAGIEYGRMKGQ